MRRFVTSVVTALLLATGLAGAQMSRPASRVATRPGGKELAERMRGLIEQLHSAPGDRSDGVARQVADLLPEGAPTVMEIAADGEHEYRYTALYVLGWDKMGSHAPEIAAFLRKALTDKDPRARGIALEVAFRRGIPEAEDALLIKSYQEGPADVAESVLRVIADRKAPSREVLVLVVRGLEHAEQAVCEEAGQTLRTLGASVRPVSPDLRGVARRGKDRARVAALRALAACGPDKEDAAVFLEACRNRDPWVRTAGLDALTSLDARDERIRATALRVLSEETMWGSVRASAVSALGYARPIRPEDVARLVAIAKTPKDWAASGAATALVNMIGEYPGALEIVADLLAPGIDSSMHNQCRWALMRSAPRHPKLLRHMKALIAAKDVGFSEMDYIVGLGPDGAMFADDLLNCLAGMTDKDDVVCQWIVERLPRVHGVDAARAVPILLKSLRGHENLRGYTAQAIGAYGPQAAQAVPALLKELDRKDGIPGFAVCHAIEALGRIGPASAAALPRLRPIVADPGQYRREYYSSWHKAVVSVAKIDPPSAADMVTLLRAEVRSDVPWRRAWALSCLGQIGPPAEAALADIRPLLEDPRGPFFRSAACAAARLGLLREVMDKVVAELKSGDTARVIDACHVAGDIGASAQAALPVLRDLLNGDSEDIGSFAAGAIQEITGENVFTRRGGRAR